MLAMLVLSFASGKKTIGATLIIGGFVRQTFWRRRGCAFYPARIVGAMPTAGAAALAFTQMIVRRKHHVWAFPIKIFAFDQLTHSLELYREQAQAYNAFRLQFLREVIHEKTILSLARSVCTPRAKPARANARLACGSNQSGTS